MIKVQLYNPDTDVLVTYYLDRPLTVKEAFSLVTNAPIEKYVDGVTYEEFDESYIIQNNDMIYPVIKTSQVSKLA